MLNYTGDNLCRCLTPFSIFAVFRMFIRNDFAELYVKCKIIFDIEHIAKPLNIISITIFMH